MFSDHERITGDNQSPLINLVLWVAMIAAILSVLTELSTKWIMVRRMELDDLYMIAAMVLIRRWVSGRPRTDSHSCAGNQ